MFYLERQLERCELCQQVIGINNASTVLRLRRWWQQRKRSLPLLNLRPPSSTCRAGVFLCSVLFVLFLLGVLVGYTMQMGHDHCRCLHGPSTAPIGSSNRTTTVVYGSATTMDSGNFSGVSPTPPASSTLYEPLLHGPALPVLSAMCALLLVFVVYSLRRCFAFRTAAAARRQRQQRGAADDIEAEAAIEGEDGGPFS